MVMMVPAHNLENMLMGGILRGTPLKKGWNQVLNHPPVLRQLIDHLQQNSWDLRQSPNTLQPLLGLCLPEYRIQNYCLNQLRSPARYQLVHSLHIPFFKPNSRIQGKYVSVSLPTFVRRIPI